MQGLDLRPTNIFNLPSFLANKAQIEPPSRNRSSSDLIKRIHHSHNIVQRLKAKDTICQKTNINKSLVHRLNVKRIERIERGALANEIKDRDVMANGMAEGVDGERRRAQSVQLKLMREH